MLINGTIPNCKNSPPHRSKVTFSQSWLEKPVWRLLIFFWLIELLSTCNGMFKFNLYFAMFRIEIRICFNKSTGFMWKKQNKMVHDIYGKKIASLTKTTLIFPVQQVVMGKTKCFLTQEPHWFYCGDMFSARIGKPGFFIDNASV